MNAPKALAPLLLVSVAFAAQQDVKAKITAYYAKTDALTLRKDLAGLTKQLTDYTTNDFALYEKPDAQGKAPRVTRAETIKTTGKALDLVDKFEKVQSHIDKYVVIDKNTIAVTMTATVSMTSKPDKGGKAHQFTDVATSTDTWIKTAGTWKMKTSKTVKEKLTRDGEEVL